MSTSSSLSGVGAVGPTPNSGGPSGPVTLEKEPIQLNQHQPMDLAPRGPSVVLRPVRPVFSTIQTHPSAKNNNITGVNVNPTIATIHSPGTPIISVNRTTPANLTLLPARATGQVGLGLGVGVGIGQVQANTQGIPTYQITRVGNVRPGAAGQQQPASITVTPLPTSNLSANIRLAGATVNNGTWIQTSGGQPGFTPMRAATITVGGRPVRPEAKMIHIPQQHHVTQLQMVDGKGSILKPQLTTPIVNIRGTLPGGANSGSSMTLPISPFTIRTANITNISTIQQRPQTITTTSSNQVHKVITQPGHSAPIQFVNANKNPHVIQTITPIPKLSTVCLTLSTNATLAPNNSSPVVAVASRPGGTPSLIMTPSALGGSVGSATALPITKVYPVGRDGTSLVENIFSSSASSAVSVSTVNITAPGTNSNPNSSVVVAATNQPQHVLVHTTPTINVHTGPHPSTGLASNLAPGSMGSIAPGYFLDKNFQMNIVPHPAQTRPIALDKKIDSKGLIPGGMIFATTTNHPHNTVTIPLTQNALNITHLGQPPGNTQMNSNPNLICTTSATPTLNQNHHPQILAQIPHSMITVSTPSITVTPSTTSQNQFQNQSIPISIPTHVISQSIGVTSTTVGSILTITTTTISSTTTTGPTTISSSATTNVNSTGSGSSTTATTSSTISSSSTSSSTLTTTAPPAQSPNHNQSNQNSSTKSTHSPRPSILRKRELGEHHHPTHSTSRAQRNLSLQLNFTSSNSTNFTSSNNKENALGIDKFSSSSSSSSSLSTTTTSVGGTGGGATGVSILKKEFQPPTEESSWHSVSSNSSSGSSTISALSETAELQLQQQLSLVGVGVGAVDLNLTSGLPLHSSSVESSTSAFVGVGLGSSSTPLSSSKPSGVGLSVGGLGLNLNTSTNRDHSSSQNQNFQNGVLRASQPRSRSSSTSKGSNKDVERLKIKDKDLDAVSPRKKPRKQQLTSNEAASPEIYYQGKGKRFRKGDLMDFSEGLPDKVGVEPIPEEPPPPRIIYHITKRHMSLMRTNSIPPKPLATHFLRYCDVKAKDEKRPTVSELANQKNIMQKVSGWRVQHMTSQMEELVEGESSVVNKCTALLNRLEDKSGGPPDRDLNNVLELLKGNIQRCKVIRDQMSESMVQAIKILDHKPHVIEVITKYSSKRPPKRRDRNL